MEVKFDSHLDKGKVMLKLGVMLPVLAVPFHMLSIGFSLNTTLIVGGLSLLALGFIIWQLSYTFYLIGDGYLRYRSGGRHGKIKVREIESIQKCRQWLPMSDASRSLHGFLIRFCDGQLFVGPREEESFIKALQKDNPSIRILS